MKFPSQEELHEYTSAIAAGALKGAAVGGMLSVGGFFYVKTRMPHFLTYGAFPRTFFMIAPPIICGITSMEFASRRFENERYQMKNDAQKYHELQHANDTTGQKISNFFGEHRYQFITAGWAASMGASYWLVNRDKYMTKSQKIVQARMYAQSLTVVMLLASVVLSADGGKVSHNGRFDVEEDNDLSNPNHKKQDWEIVVEKEAAREKAAHLPLKLSERHNNVEA